MTWVNVWEIKRILQTTELACGDSSSEWTDPLQDSSVSGNDMNTIDLGSAVGATLYIKSDKGSTASSRKGHFSSQLQTLRKKEMPGQIGHNTAITAGVTPKKEAGHPIPKFPCATIKQLTQVEHMGAAA